ncbi:AsmA family protein [uncultured Ferrimonas sp.]|uniref:AsmA family protein n=1 Tax=uncultured Ferrimonas sp. TaxID=432640 RepID=UPI00262725F3|nr:AsmA family protein [uncultured Ferrimonas sp.]
MQIIKWIAIALVALLLLVVGYVAFVLDLNSYKPVISDKVNEATGRDLVIDGDIGLSFYPTLGMQLQGVSLSNIPNESLPPLLQITQASVGVALMPLLASELQIESIVVDGATLTMVTLADGRTSTTGLGGSSTADSSQPSTDSGGADAAANDWSLGLFQLNDLQLVNDNRGAATVQTITIKQLELSNLAPARSAPLKLMLALDDGGTTLETEASSMLAFAKDFSRIQIDDWQQSIRIDGEAVANKPMALALQLQADIDLNQQTLSLPSLQLGLDEFQFDAQGSLAYGGKVPYLQLTGKGNRLDLTPYMVSQQTDDSKPSEEPQQAPSPEPDLRVMTAINAKVTLGLESLLADNIQVDDLNTELLLQDGVLTLKQLSGTTFDGDFKVTASLDGRQVPARYQFTQSLSGLKIQPLLQALADTELLEGSGDLTLSGKGVGLAGDALLQNLTAKGELALADGALYGVNLAKMVRDGTAAFTGGETSADETVKKTDFSSVNVSLAVADGQLQIPSLALASPLLRVDGKGQLGLVDQAIAMDLVVALVGSMEGQGGSGTDQLVDLPIPLKIGGTVTEPSYGLDLDGLKDQLLDKEKDKLKQKLEDKLKSKLFGALGN